MTWNPQRRETLRMPLPPQTDSPLKCTSIPAAVMFMPGRTFTQP
nr:MAG TPA: hypothetical protein [Caudoviricetes sp.]